jgi:hypothetical protein
MKGSDSNVHGGWASDTGSLAGDGPVITQVSEPERLRTGGYNVSATLGARVPRT